MTLNIKKLKPLPAKNKQEKKRLVKSLEKALQGVLADINKIKKNG